MGSEITLNIFFKAWYKLIELNKVLMAWYNACGMGQSVEVGWWVSVDQLGGRNKITT